MKKIYHLVPLLLCSILCSCSPSVETDTTTVIESSETQTFPVTTVETSSTEEAEEPTESTENETTIEDTSAPESESPETSNDSETVSDIPDISNALLIAPVREAPVMNGFKTERIGTRAYVKVSKDDLKTITNEQYTTFVDTVVKDSGYNWFTIFCDDGTGICFAGSIGFFAEYGILDEEGSITEVIGYITISEEGYTYEEAE